MCAIDIYSKYVWVDPFTVKQGMATAETLLGIYQFAGWRNSKKLRYIKAVKSIYW